MRRLSVFSETKIAFNATETWAYKLDLIFALNTSCRTMTETVDVQISGLPPLELKLFLFKIIMKYLGASVLWTTVWSKL